MLREQHPIQDRLPDGYAQAQAIIRLTIISLLVFLGGCSSLLPRAQTITEGPWLNYQEAQKAFDQIIPYQTTLEDLKKLRLDATSNPNIVILTYSDVIRRFIPSPSVSAQELAPGVRECIMATLTCKGYEVVQKFMQRKRVGSFWLDFTNFKRTVDVTGWSFNGVILVKDNLVIYTLAGGLPAVHEVEKNNNPLGPFQGSGESAMRNSLSQ